jgi:hypothetical protein
MRSFLVRCLVVLLSLALASGNAHAALHLDRAHGDPCPAEHSHQSEMPSSHRHHDQQEHHHHDGLACCCDCLGCSSAVWLAPELAVTPAGLPARVEYDERAAPLSGRALLPEPHPPRRGTLS